MVAVIVQENLHVMPEAAARQRARRCRRPLFDDRHRRVLRIAGVDEDLVRRATRRIASASVAVFEDLGVQMNRHSTLVSTEKLVWTLTGNFANPGGQYIPSTMVPIVKACTRPSSIPSAPRALPSPVSGSSAG